MVFGEVSVMNSQSICLAKRCGGKQYNVNLVEYQSHVILRILCPN
jgi:hypothetical protein